MITGVVPVQPEDTTITGTVLAQTEDPTITGTVPAQPEDLMITGSVPAQPEDPTKTAVVPAQPEAGNDEPPTTMTPAQPSGLGDDPLTTAMLGTGRSVSGTVPPTPPPASRAEDSPPLQISSRPVSPLADPLTTMSVAAAATAQSDRSRTRRAVLLVAAAAAVVIVAAVGIYFVIGRSSGGGSSAGAAAPVNHAARKMVRKKSVDMTFYVSVASTGSSTPAGSAGLTGNGSFDLSLDSGNLTLTASGPGSPGTEQMVFIGSTVYVSFSDVGTLVPGKSWISADTSELASTSTVVGSGASSFEQLIGNPAAVVQQLKSSGLTVTSLGGSTFDGTPVQGYRVDVSKATIDGPAGVSAGVHGSETVYVTSKKLLRAIVVPITVEDSGTSFHESLTIAFSNYGTPVNVASPPPTQVVSYAEFQTAQK